MTARIGLATITITKWCHANLFWFLYPTGWALTDGDNVIGVTKVAIDFAILDLLSLPVLVFAFIFLSERWDYGWMNLRFTQHGRGPNTAEPFLEKRTGTIGGPGVGDGADITGGYSQPTADYNNTPASYNEIATARQYSAAPSV